MTAACSSSSSSPPQPPAPEVSAKPETPVSTAVIELGPLTISMHGKQIAKLHADGRTESAGPQSTPTQVSWVPGPKLHAHGGIVLTKGGFTARVEANGDIYIVSPPSQEPPEQLFGHINGHELKFATAKMPWHVRIDGTALVFNGPGEPNEVEGAVTPGLRRTALVLTAAFFMDLSITKR